MAYINQLNITQICSIEKITNKICDDYIYKEFKKRAWFLPNIKQGYYYVDWEGSETYVEKEQILKNNKLYIADHKVYYKPYVIITMNNKFTYEKYFDTVEKMEEFLTSEPLAKMKYIVQ